MKRWLGRIINNINYQIVKWRVRAKLHRFLSKREYNAVMQYYDAIYKEEVEELSK